MHGSIPLRSPIAPDFSIAPRESKFRAWLRAARIWTAAASKKQASEITQSKRRRIPSFGWTPPTQSTAGASASSARKPSRKRAARSTIRPTCASHPRVGNFRIYRPGAFRDCMRVRKRQNRFLKPLDEQGLHVVSPNDD